MEIEEDSLHFCFDWGALLLAVAVEGGPTFPQELINRKSCTLLKLPSRVADAFSVLRQAGRGGWGTCVSDGSYVTRPMGFFGNALLVWTNSLWLGPSGKGVGNFERGDTLSESLVKMHGYSFTLRWAIFVRAVSVSACRNFS